MPDEFPGWKDLIRIESAVDDISLAAEKASAFKDESKLLKEEVMETKGTALSRFQTRRSNTFDIIFLIYNVIGLITVYDYLEQQPIYKNKCCTNHPRYIHI